MKKGPKPIGIEKRFWLKVKKTKGCWHWTGATMTSGYGQIFYNGKCRGAHVVSAIMAGMKVTQKSHVMHTCDNKRCVNPAHLQIGNALKNQRDYAFKCYNAGIDPLKKRSAADKGWGHDRQRAIWRAEGRKK